MSAVDAAEVIVDLLQRGHAVEFRVRGDSMHPSIREHDLVHVAPSGEVRVNDVVLALADRGLTAHRVIAVNGEQVLTRGDNTPSADRALARDRILGKVVWVERNGARRAPFREPILLRALRRLRRTF